MWGDVANGHSTMNFPLIARGIEERVNHHNVEMALSAATKRLVDENEIERELQASGFEEHPMDPLKTRKGEWRVYTRPRLAMPQFPEGEVSYSTMLATYRRNIRKGTEFNMVLQPSSRGDAPESFFEGIEIINNNFLEKPFFWGVQGTLWQTPLPAAAAGAVAGSFADSYIEPFSSNPELITSPEISVLFGIVGFVGGLLFGTAGLYFRDSRASTLAQDLNQRGMFVGTQATQFLDREQIAGAEALVQREMYERFQEETGITVEPQVFLDNVYGNLAREVRQQRIAEVRAGTEGTNTLDRMVQIAEATAPYTIQQYTVAQ